jgi:hypothetical protein
MWYLVSWKISFLGDTIHELDIIKYNIVGPIKILSPFCIGDTNCKPSDINCKPSDTNCKPSDTNEPVYTWY